MRGMEWVGREVFERGFWKSGEDLQVEIEVLDTEEGDQLTDGIIQDEDTDDHGNELKNEPERRWIRITRTAVNLAGLIDGFTWVEGTREWKVDGTLEAKYANGETRTIMNENRRKFDVGAGGGPTTQWTLTLTMRKRTNLQKVRTAKRIRKR
ncbi:hypothetical protein JVT61DRAFT_2651 [Boletus reticuloceps]|uniref:Uncharacterized protein n=1 Tax=Boletus reticuloceps TaxID=495285 RepID=A0A8I2YQW9_9AGAM|nr:hypothetical protein JVT61DRAFT_2651 [Boletus reticuloceps]